MDDLKRNGSGCYDPTAYKAIRNVENGGTEMNIRKGEIWEVEHGKDSKLALVLAFKGSYCSVLLLNDEPRETRDIQLNARGMKFTESGMISYKFVDAFVDFVRKTTDEEFQDVMHKVCESLEMIGSENKNQNKEINDLHMMLKCSEQTSEQRRKMLEDSQKQLSDAIDHIEVLNCTIEQLETELAEKNNNPSEVIVLKTERDLYKQQYDSLLERLIG